MTTWRTVVRGRLATVLAYEGRSEQRARAAHTAIVGVLEATGGTGTVDIVERKTGYAGLVTRSTEVKAGEVRIEIEKA